MFNFADANLLKAEHAPELPEGRASWKAGNLRTTAIYLLAMCSLGLPVFSRAQVSYAAPNPTANQPGMPNSASFEGTQEQVNLNNGNVDVALPLLHLKGIANLDLDLTLLYDSKVYVMRDGKPPQPQSDGTTSYIPPTLDPQFISGPSFAGGRISLPTLSYNIVPISFYIAGGGCTGSDCSSPGGGGGVHGTLSCKGQFVFADSSGAQHSFTNFPSCEQSQVVPVNVDDVGDGSLLRLDTTNVQDMIVSDRSGIQYHFNLDDLTSNLGLPFRINDPNGNQITIAHSGSYPNPVTVTITDTLNRNVTITPNDIAYRDSSGALQHITATPGSAGSNAASMQVNYCESNDNAFRSQGGTVNGSGNGTSWIVQLPPSGSYSSGAQYGVFFDSLAELTKITYPTGGYTSYVYQNVPSTYVDDNWSCSADTREIKERHVCSLTTGNCNASSEAITYYSANTLGTKQALDGNVTMDVTDAQGNRTHHVFNELGWPTYPGNLGSRETDTVMYSGQSSAVKQIHYDYGNGNSQITSCTEPTSITTSLLDGASPQSSYTTFGYQAITLHPGTNNEPNCLSANITLKSEYDYSGQLIRTTSQSWLSSDSSSLYHLLDRVTNISTSNSTSNPSFTTNHGLQYDSRGNMVGKTLSGTNAQPVLVSTPRDSYGRTLSLTDGRGYVTTYGYSPAWSGNSCQPTISALPTTITNARQQTTAYVYNPCTTSVSSVMDPNGAVTSYAYDPLGRVTNTSFPDGGSTGVDYNPGAGGAVKTTRASSGGNIVDVEVHDGVGRVSSSQHLAPEGTIRTDYTWDSRGLRSSVSNPYIGTAGAATSFAYDALGRMHYRCNADNGRSSCSPGQSYAEWDYAGSGVDVFDEVRHHSREQVDAAGRLTDVWEPDGSNNPSLHTAYTYNISDALISVQQYGDGSNVRTRVFDYDGLGHLLTASNPESGITCYGLWSSSKCSNGYDLNGNLLAKTDARGVVTAYTYDTLNRLLSKTYSGITSPSSCFLYDVNGSASPVNAVGRMTAEWTQAGACGSGNAVPSSGTYTRKIIDAYDAMGRVRSQRLCNRSGCAIEHPQPFTYDLAGNLNTYTDGLASKTFTLNYDSAGRLSSLGSSLSDVTHPGTLFNVTDFEPLGWDTAVFGNAMNATRHFDLRERVVDMTVKAGAQ